MYKGTGTLEYNDTMRALLWVDQEISNYYRSLIPRHYCAQPQRYMAHVTVVRNNIDQVQNLDVWNKYAGEKIDFEYDGRIHFDGRYFYLNIDSERIGDIREELGLPRFRMTELGASMDCYHMTIANVKHQLEHR